MDENVIRAWTDGGANPNPGPGAYGAVIPIEGSEEVIKLSKGYQLTTNNRMEMMAVIALLKEFGPNKTFEIHLDSNYVRQGCVAWVWGWARKKWINTDWKTGIEKPIKNLDLWKEMHGLLKENKITWLKVKAHTGNKYNEMADQLCTETMKTPTEVDQGYLDSLR